MKSIILCLISFILLGCTKTTYVLKQGIAQFNLESSGRLNEDVLADKKIDKRIKDKIRKIESYKKFFYEYFQEESTTIYNKTTFLDSKAVTYLVIASPVNEIKALEHDFPIVGKFPYLGFFSRKDAKEFAKELRAKKYETYTRDVYAYSTLNQWIFSDNILSSFFHFKEEELASLIFHELFHTVFFVPDEVELNENLAQFISRKLVIEYFKQTDEYLSQKKRKQVNNKLLYQAISKHAKNLNDEYKKVKDNYVELRNVYLEKEFFPDLKQLCFKNKIKDCWAVNIKWNNARLVSFLTYESKQDKIKDYYEMNNFNLKSFYKHLQKKYKKYSKKNRDINFQQYLFKR